MSPVGFEPTVSAGERPQNYALDRAATGTGQRNRCCCGYTLSITDFVFVSLSLIIQNAKRMRHIMLSSVSCPAPPCIFFFPNCLLNDTIFGKKVVGHKMCVLIVQFLCETFLVLRRLDRGMIIKVNTASCKVTVIFVWL